MHRHSVAIVDGYVYVQSRWKPTEQPKELWADEASRNNARETRRMSSGRDALQVLEQLRPRFHPDPAEVDGALENQFAAGPREIQGAGGASYAISNPVLQYIADLPASDWTSVESGCGYSTVVLANSFGNAHLRQSRSGVEPSGA